MWHELPLALMLANTAYLCKLWVTKERHADQPLICFLEHVINLLHANKITKFLQLFSIKRKKKNQIITQPFDKVEKEPAEADNVPY